MASIRKLPTQAQNRRHGTRVARLCKAVLLLAVVSVRERMGSGGPRGLQIPWSGASGVRGGFDSHAFPPLFTLALALALIAAPARAQAPPESARPNVPVDTIAHPPDIQVVNSSTLDADAKAAKKAHSDSLKTHGWSAQPRFVMARSLLIPGWGQAYNHAWLKAGAV